MTSSDLNKIHRKKRTHFANIVKLALVDGVLTEEEKELLDNLSVSLGIQEEEYQKILENPDVYPIRPPVTYEERIERLYNLTKMIFIDEEIVGDEVDLLQKIAIELGFPKDKVERIIEKAIHLIINNFDYDKYVLAIKKIYTN